MTTGASVLRSSTIGRLSGILCGPGAGTYSTGTFTVGDGALCLG